MSKYSQHDLETETYIHWSEADRKEGFFTFDSSSRHETAKFLRRVGKENILSIREHGGHTTAKVRFECLSPSRGFRRGISAARSEAGRRITPGHRQAN